MIWGEISVERYYSLVSNLFVAMKTNILAFITFGMQLLQMVDRLLIEIYISLISSLKRN